MMNHQKSRLLLKALLIFTALTFALILPHRATAQSTPTLSPGLVHREKIKAKLNSIVIDKVNFDKADIAVVLDFLTKKCKELDPEKEGINFVLRLPDAAASATDTQSKIKVHREVSMTLDSIPLADLLNEIGQQTNLTYTVEDYAVYLHP